MSSARVIVTYIVTLLFLISSTTVAYAFVSSSTNFSINGEFGDFGGQKNSTNYILTDTGGGFAPGFSNSSNFTSCSGFQCVLAKVPSITFTLSSTTASLGTLNTSAVNTASHTATVITNWNGYTVTVIQDGNMCRISLPCNSANDIDPVSGGTVSTGVEEYGLATSVSGQTITQDTSCGSAAYNATDLSTSTPKSVASSTTYTSASGDTFTLCYAASISGTTAAGSYTQKVTYIATGSF